MMNVLTMTSKMGSQPNVLIQKVTAMMNRVGNNLLIFWGHVMDHGQKVHQHFIKTKEECQPDCNNARIFVLF